jgi:hypothetical protein
MFCREVASAPSYKPRTRTGVAKVARCAARTRDGRILG